MGFTQPHVMKLGETLDQRRKKNSTRKSTSEFLARRARLRQEFTTWTRTGVTVSDHGYCDAAAEEEQMEAGQASSRKRVSPSVARTARAVGKQRPIVGTCPRCSKQYKDAKALATHAAQNACKARKTGQPHKRRKVAGMGVSAARTEEEEEEGERDEEEDDEDDEKGEEGRDNDDDDDDDSDVEEDEDEDAVDVDGDEQDEHGNDDGVDASEPGAIVLYVDID